MYGVTSSLYSAHVVYTQERNVNIQTKSKSPHAAIHAPTFNERVCKEGRQSSLSLSHLFEVKQLPLLDPLLGLQLLGLLQDPAVHVGDTATAAAGRHPCRTEGGGEGGDWVAHEGEARGGIQDIVKERRPLAVLGWLFVATSSQF